MNGSQYTAIGILISSLVVLSNVVYRMGHLNARVEELERWRNSIRQDMHEISDKMEQLGNNIKYLSVLIEERTERRLAPREKV